MSAPSPRPGGRSARVRHQVLEATAQILLADGLDAATIPAIAERSGAHHTSIYRRWPDRGILIHDAITHTVDAVVPVPDTGHVRSDLIELFTGVRALLAGVHHKYGAAAATNIAFDDIDVERLSYTNDGNRTWLAVMTGNSQGVGPITGVTVSDVKIRDAGTTAARVNGQPDAVVSGVALRGITMPGKTTAATSLAEVNLINLSNYADLTIAP